MTKSILGQKPYGADVVLSQTIHVWNSYLRDWAIFMG